MYFHPSLYVTGYTLRRPLPVWWNGWTERLTFCLISSWASLSQLSAL